MKILAPIDGSECSVRALRFGAEMALRYDAELHVVHITDYRGDATEDILDRARAILDEVGIEADPEVLTDLSLSDPKYANRIGKDILDLVEEEGYDHVVMGHHGSGAVGRFILGSAAETVIRAAETPATVVP